MSVSVETLGLWSVVFLAGAVFGAWIGWLNGTRAMYARSFDAQEPPDLPPVEMMPAVARRKRDRIIASGLYAVFCAAAASMPLAALLR